MRRYTQDKVEKLKNIKLPFTSSEFFAFGGVTVSLSAAFSLGGRSGWLNSIEWGATNPGTITGATIIAVGGIQKALEVTSIHREQNRRVQSRAEMDDMSQPTTDLKFIGILAHHPDAQQITYEFAQIEREHAEDLQGDLGYEPEN